VAAVLRLEAMRLEPKSAPADEKRPPVAGKGFPANPTTAAYSPPGLEEAGGSDHK